MRAPAVTVRLTAMSMPQSRWRRTDTKIAAGNTAWQSRWRIGVRRHRHGVVRKQQRHEGNSHDCSAEREPAEPDALDDGAAEVPPLDFGGGSQADGDRRVEERLLEVVLPR